MRRGEMTSDERDKPYILIAVSGGVAEVVRGSTVANVEIISFDDLEQNVGSDFNKKCLSRRAQTFLKNADEPLWQRLYGKGK